MSIVVNKNLPQSETKNPASSSNRDAWSFSTREWKQLPNEDIYTYCDRIETALHLQEDRIAAIAAGSNVAIWEWERDNDIIRVSSHFYALLGLEPPMRKLHLKGLIELLHPADRESLFHRMRSFLKSGKRFSFDCRFVGYGGNYIWMNLSGKASFDEHHRVCRVSGSLSDISVRVEACNARRDSEAIFESTFAESMAGLAIVGLDSKFVYVNRSLCKMLDYRASELVGKSIIEVTHPEDRSKTLPNLSQTASDAASSMGFEKRYLRKNGEPIWVRLNANVHHDSEGLPIHYIFEVTDLSENKRAEQERLELEAALRHAQVMEMIGTLTGGVAHDLNNLLAPIVGYTDIVMNECKSNTEVMKSLEIIRESTDRARDLVKNMLTFCRKEEGKSTVVKLSSVVESCSLLLRPIVPDSVKIQHLQETDHDMVAMEPRQIHQILMNLATNALHAMKDSGGSLTFKLSETTIGEKTFGELGLARGKYVCVEVSDTGSGMSDEISSRVFEPFFTTKAPDEGTGLGLFVVRGIIRRHDGAIALTSKPGAGTTFKLYLPMAESFVEVEQSPIQEALNAGIRIMWVDDDRLVLDLGKKMLEYLGYQAVCHTSPVAALSEVENEDSNIDLIISDSSMPGFHGEQFIDVVRTRRPDLPIILCSGLSDPSDETGYGPANAILPKPFSVKELARMIRGVLSEQERIGHRFLSASVAS